MTKKNLIFWAIIVAFLVVVTVEFIYVDTHPHKRLTHYAQPDTGDTMMTIKRIDTSKGHHMVFSIATTGFERELLVDRTDSDNIKWADELHMLHIQGSANKYLANYWVWLEPGDSLICVNNLTGSAMSFRNFIDTAQWCRVVGPPDGIWRNNELFVRGEITLTDDRINL